MIAVVQRVARASVVVDAAPVGAIQAGMLVLCAIEVRDTPADIAWMAAKLVSMRMFRNGEKYFDFDVRQAKGGILLVSNFTVAAATGSGRRPGLSNAAPPERARLLFDQLVEVVRAAAGPGVPVATGQFGAEMKVDLLNEGPVTFLVESPKPV
jgi:D-tyrosyl-tRNA(Tyr) deacylase